MKTAEHNKKTLIDGILKSLNDSERETLKAIDGYVDKAVADFEGETNFTLQGDRLPRKCANLLKAKGYSLTLVDSSRKSFTYKISWV